MADKKHLVITTSSERAMHEIASDLTKAGFKVEHLLDSIGSITGHLNTSSMQKIRAVKGVVDVAPSTAVDIGPPGADKTW